MPADSPLSSHNKSRTFFAYWSEDVFFSYINRNISVFATLSGILESMAVEKCEQRWKIQIHYVDAKMSGITAQISKWNHSFMETLFSVVYGVEE